MADEPVLDDAALLASLQELIASKGPEFSIGFDTPRVWATGVQAFVNPSFSILAFREQMLFPKGAGAEPIVRNVSSVVVPTSVLVDFYKNLGPILEPLAAAAEQNVSE